MEWKTNDVEFFILIYFFKKSIYPHGSRLLMHSQQKNQPIDQLGNSDASQLTCQTGNLTWIHNKYKYDMIKSGPVLNM